jgi:hypothetical protein
LVFNDFDWEVKVTSWDLEEENKSLRIVSEDMGYTIPDIGKTALLIIHQSILITSLSHNLLSTMQMRLHDVVVNETPTFQCLKPTDLSHSISVQGDDVDFGYSLGLSWCCVLFSNFKKTYQREFETCDRYELTFETP